MAFAVSRSSKRNRGQYEDSNVSQGEDCLLQSLKIDSFNTPGNGVANDPIGLGGGAEVAFRNKCSYYHFTDDPTGKILMARDIDYPEVNTEADPGWVRSAMFFQTAFDQTGSGGYPTSLNRMRLDSIGRLFVAGAVTAPSATLTSDDRLKHNEKDVTGALDTIMKLKGKEYIKTQKLYDENHNFTLDADGDPIEIDEEGNEKKLPQYQYTWEKGFIAQEVEADIPELAKSVSKTRNLDNEEVNRLNYSDIFVTNVCATQELCELVQKLTLRVQKLETVIL